MKLTEIVVTLIFCITFVVIVNKINKIKKMFNFNDVRNETHFDSIYKMFDDEEGE